jgi:hypothetical protein
VCYNKLNKKEMENKIMEFTLKIETIEMDTLKISNADAPSRYYNLDKWTVGAAVENYINTELLDEE